MALYFNPTRGIINVSLRTGAPAVVLPKGYLQVSDEEDRSPSILSRERKGLLIKLKDTEKAEAADPRDSAEAAPSEPAAPADLDEVEKKLGSPTMKWRKTELLSYAASKDLRVTSSMTKVEILRVIDEAAG